MKNKPKKSEPKYPLVIRFPKPKGSCRVCGLTICPGARGRKCAAQKATAEEWEELKKTKWV